MGLGFFFPRCYMGKERGCPVLAQNLMMPLDDVGTFINITAAHMRMESYKCTGVHHYNEDTSQYKNKGLRCSSRTPQN